MLEVRGVSSPSKISICEKSASPIPIIITLKGSKEASTRISIVSCKSSKTPSVKIINIWYSNISFWFILDITLLIKGPNFVGPENVNLLFSIQSWYVRITLSKVCISGFFEKFKLKHIEASSSPGEFILAPKPNTGNIWSSS